MVCGESYLKISGLKNPLLLQVLTGGQRLQPVLQGAGQFHHDRTAGLSCGVIDVLQERRQFTAVTRLGVVPGNESDIIIERKRRVEIVLHNTQIGRLEALQRTQTSRHDHIVRAMCRYDVLALLFAGNEAGQRNG